MVVLSCNPNTGRCTQDIPEACWLSGCGGLNEMFPQSWAFEYLVPDGGVVWMGVGG